MKKALKLCITLCCVTAGLYIAGRIMAARAENEEKDEEAPYEPENASELEGEPMET